MTMRAASEITDTDSRSMYGMTRPQSRFTGDAMITAYDILGEQPMMKG